MATRTISVAGGNYNVAATWVEVAVPTSADDVVATALSGNLNITAAAAAKSVDLTGYVGTLTHNSAITWTISGNAKFVAGMTYTIGGVTSNITLAGTTVGSTLTTGGKTLPKITINHPSNTASHVLQDDLACGIVIWSRGGFDANNKNVTLSSLTATTTNVKFITLGSGTWTFLCNDESSTFAVNVNIASGLTWNTGTATFVFNNPPVAVKSIDLFGDGSGQGLTVYNMVVNGNAVYRTLSIGNYFTVSNSLTINGPCGISFLASSGLYITSGFVKTGGLFTLTSETPGVQFFFDGNGQTITLSGLSLTDSLAQNGTWTATNSIDGGDNTGWTITPPVNSVDAIFFSGD